MKFCFPLILFAAILASSAACSSQADTTHAFVPSQASAARNPVSKRHLRPADSGNSCDATPVMPGQSQCLLFDQTFPSDIYDADPNNVNACNGSKLQAYCYGPVGLRSAYDLTTASKQMGSGMTVAIVDFYNYENAAKDLAAYRAKFSLAPCDGCLRIVNEEGKTSPLPVPAPSSPPYAEESALDIQMVSAICPNCNILLVEADTPGVGDAISSVATAEALGANVISNSYVWGGELFSTLSTFDDHPGVVITAGAGDSGAGCGINGGNSCSAQQPCSFKGVVCVGGTTLKPDSATSRGFREVVWDGLTSSNYCPAFNGNPASPCATGSGCSSQVAKPSWQRDKGCSKRSESDISADADPNTGVVIIFNGVKRIVGGTSAATPMIAAMFALAGNTNTATPATIWSNGDTDAFWPVTAGTNESDPLNTFICPSGYEYICKAGTGMNSVFSGPAGWGTPRGLAGL